MNNAIPVRPGSSNRRRIAASVTCWHNHEARSVRSRTQPRNQYNVIWHSRKRSEKNRLRIATHKSGTIDDLHASRRLVDFGGIAPRCCT